MPIGGLPIGVLPLGGRGVAVLLVGIDDVLHEPMPDDIAALQFDHSRSLDAGKFFHRVDQSTANVGGQIHLRGVAGDDHFGVMSQPCQKHEHLRRGRILCLIENDNAVVESSSAHKSERNYFDHVVDHEPFDLLELHHVVQGVEKRAKIRVYLRLHVAGKESEAFTGLNRRAGQDDPLGLPVLENTGGGGDGEVGLARPRGTGAKSQVVVKDRIEVVPLPGVFGLMARPLA